MPGTSCPCCCQYKPMNTSACARYARDTSAGGYGDAWVRRGWATGYLHPQSGNRVVRAGPAEIERLRGLHLVPRGQHNRRRWMKDQAAGINIESDTEENDDETAPQE